MAHLYIDGLPSYTLGGFSMANCYIVITRWYIPDPISSQRDRQWSTGHRLRDRQLPQSDPAGALSPAQWGASGTIRSFPVVPWKTGAMKTSVGCSTI